MNYNTSCQRLAEEEDRLSSAGRQNFSTSDGKFLQMDTVGGYKEKTHSI